MIMKCNKSLLTFISHALQERVRQTAIPLEEVFKRNNRGHELSLPPPKGVGKRGETLLIMSGMVSGGACVLCVMC